MDRWLSFVLLMAGVASAIRHPPWLPAWAGPVLAVLVDLAVGVIGPDRSARAVHPLVQPVAFLLAAVPLAVMLDELGFFRAVAARVNRRGGGPGYLWALAAVVTTVLNLDAGVVLLTPLYVRVAHERGWDPLVLAAQPVLLACLASSALPVSNLTNLIAVSWAGASTAQFVTHLALPSLAASSVGWWCYHRWCAAGLHGGSPGVAAPGGDGQADRAGPAPAGAGDDGADERYALRVGGGVVGGALVGFTCGPLVGVQPWVVALVADALLAVLLTRAVARRSAAGAATSWSARTWASLPWRAVPVGTAIMVFGLGVLATGATRYLPTGQLLRGASLPSLARETGLAALAANLVNNLPALLVALPKLGHHAGPELWAVLLGVNMGPVLLVTGSLASLLWMSTLRRLGVGVGPAEFTRFGLRSALPGAAAAFAVALALRAAGLH